MTTKKVKEEKEKNGPGTIAKWPLERQWKFWMQCKPDRCPDPNMLARSAHSNPIGEIVEFWRHWNHLPNPLHFFGQSNSQYEGLSFFRADVVPQWEDPVNRDGCAVILKVMMSGAKSEPEIAHDLWQETLMLMIGERLDGSEHWVGSRLLDRATSFRLEFWFDTRRLSVLKSLLGRIVRELAQDSWTVANTEPLYAPPFHRSLLWSEIHRLMTLGPEHLDPWNPDVTSIGDGLEVPLLTKSSSSSSSSFLSFPSGGGKTTGMHHSDRPPQHHHHHQPSSSVLHRPYSSARGRPITLQQLAQRR